MLPTGAKKERETRKFLQISSALGRPDASQTPPRRLPGPPKIAPCRASSAPEGPQKRELPLIDAPDRRQKGAGNAKMPPDIKRAGPPRRLLGGRRAAYQWGKACGRKSALSDPPIDLNGCRPGSKRGPRGAIVLSRLSHNALMASKRESEASKPMGEGVRTKKCAF